MSSDQRTDEKCEVCGAWIRAQGDYRYCPMQGMVSHILKAKEMMER